VRCVNDDPVPESPVLAYDAEEFVNGTYYYGEANCVVIPQGTLSETLDVSLFEAANVASHTRGSHSTHYLSAAKSAKVIWTEGMVLTPTLNWSGNVCTMTVTKANASDTGNALVGLYDGENGTGHLLWSFHVWAPSASIADVPNAGPSSNITALPLALGQVTGNTDTYMYYQWGRKDPLGRAADFGDHKGDLISMQGTSIPSETGTGIGNGPVALDVARRYPTVFFKNSSSPYGWISVQDNNLWSESSSTIYDPCPANYHIAPEALWSGVTTSNWDQQTDPLRITYGNLTYTSGGLRYYVDGNVHYVGSGYYWSGAVNDAYGVCLFIGSDDVDPAGSLNRALGFGVRCVQN